MKLAISKWALALGGLTLLLFASKFYILDLIDPAKSIGQVIGENAKDLIDGLNGNTKEKVQASVRDTWSNILTILSFALFVGTIIAGFLSFQKEETKWYAIISIFMAFIGLGIFFSQLAIGLIALAIIGILVVSLVVFGQI